MNCYLQLAIFSACLGLFQLGYDGSGLNQVESKIEKFLYETFKERYGIQLTTESTSTYFSFAVAIFEVGGMVGASFASYVAENFGRKRGLLYTQCFSILGGISQGTCRYASSYEMLLIGMHTDLSTVCDNSFPVDMVFIFVILCYTFG